jgi:hypothetical protein
VAVAAIGAGVAAGPSGRFANFFAGKFLANSSVDAQDFIARKTMPAKHSKTIEPNRSGMLMSPDP